MAVQTFPQAAHWDEFYATRGLIWGTEPSIVARLLARAISPAEGAKLHVLDVGCGYGRDALWLSDRTGCRVTGVDVSPRAVKAASELAERSSAGSVAFHVSAIEDVIGGYDVAIVANVYDNLRPDERAAFRSAICNAVVPGGRIFLNALAVDDPEHYGRGLRVPGEPHAFERERYTRFFTATELAEEFDGFQIDGLRLMRYVEPHVDGTVHHHAAWLLVARTPSR